MKTPRISAPHTNRNPCTGGIFYANCSNTSNAGFRAKEIENKAVWFDIEPRLVGFNQATDANAAGAVAEVPVGEDVVAGMLNDDIERVRSDLS